MEPAYADFVDRIPMGEVVLTPTWRLLHPYLQAHPQRVADLHRLLPRALHGVEAHWAFHGRQLMLERLQLPEGPDPVEEMLLWRALFPGLPRPLPAWWVQGVWRFHVWDAETGEKMGYREILSLHQGALEEPHVGEVVVNDEEVPYWYRLAALPLLLLGLPFLFMWWWWKEFRKETPRVQVLLAGLLVYMYVALPYIVLHPRGMEDARLGRLSQLLKAEKTGAAQRKAIARLVAKRGVRQG